MDHLSLVGIVPWEFVAQIANLLIQAALFKKFLFKPVQGIIAKRRGEVNAIYGMDGAIVFANPAHTDRGCARLSPNGGNICHAIGSSQGCGVASPDDRR